MNKINKIHCLETDIFRVAGNRADAHQTEAANADRGHFPHSHHGSIEGALRVRPSMHPQCSLNEIGMAVFDEAAKSRQSALTSGGYPHVL